MASQSPNAKEQTVKGIPVRKHVINDPSQLPIDLSRTPGGTMYSTTPGGK